MSEKRYSVFVEGISDPELVATNLTKEQCDVQIEQLMNDAIAPHRIKVRRIS